jgi:hypothetical protein
VRVKAECAAVNIDELAGLNVLSIVNTTSSNIAHITLRAKTKKTKIQNKKRQH